MRRCPVIRGFRCTLSARLAPTSVPATWLANTTPPDKDEGRDEHEKGLRMSVMMGEECGWLDRTKRAYVDVEMWKSVTFQVYNVDVQVWESQRPSRCTRLMWRMQTF